MNSPLVTLIILCYNHEAFIENAIQSAFNQDYNNLEIIISDDGSSDNSIEIIKRYVQNYNGKHNVRINFNEYNQGLAGHINKVLLLSKGEYIVWCGGDDVCLPNKVSRLIRPMMQNQSIVGVHSAVMKIDFNGNELGIMHNEFKDFNYKHIFQIIKEGMSVGSQSHAFRKKAFTDFGNFRKDLTNEGKVMIIREALLGEIVYLEEPLTLYRIGSGVSTYSGNDIVKRTYSEPLKIANWRLTSLYQIKEDYEKISKEFKYLENKVIINLIETELKKAKIRVAIIMEKLNWKMLFAAFRYRDIYIRSILDFAKRNLPKSLLSKFYK